MSRTPVLRACAAAAAVLLFAACEDSTGSRARDRAAVQAVDGDAQTGPAGQTLPQPIAVTVTDSRGNPVPGATVAFRVISGGGSVAPASVATSSTGLAQTTWSLGTSTTAPQRVEAAVFHPGSGALLAADTVTATATAGAPAALVRVSGDRQAGQAGQPLAAPLVVRAQDAHGNPVAGATVNWAVTSGGGTVSPVTTVTAADGTAQTTWTPGSSSTQTVRASMAGAPPVTFTTGGSGGVFITVLQPTPGAAFADTVPIRVQIDSSSAAIAQVTAEAGGRTVTLTPAAPGIVTGKLPLEGLPRTLLLTVRATAVNGDSGVVRMTILHDSPPQLNVTSPHMGQVARPNLRIDVDCVDDAGSCTDLRVHVVTGIGRGTEVETLARGTTGVHADFSLAAYDGTRIRIRIWAMDSTGRVTERDFEIFVESSTHLTELFSAGDRLLDYDATRALVGDQALSQNRLGSLRPWAVRLVDRATGAETVLASGLEHGQTNEYTGWLHPGGALFSTRGGHWFDWRNGTLTPLNLSSHVAVAGNWGAHMRHQVPGGYAVMRLNLATGASEQVAGNGSPGGSVDVAENGDVVYDGIDSNIYRVRGGVPQAITTDASGEPGGTQYYAPRTDGTLVAFRAQSSTQGPRLMLYTGTETLDLGPLAPASAGPGTDFEVENGWTAFLRADAGGVAQVWVRSPSGEVRRASSVGQSASIRSLGPNGEVVFASGNGVYLAEYPYTGAAVRVFSAGYPSTLRWRGGDLLVFLGRTAFRIDY